MARFARPRPTPASLALAVVACLLLAAPAVAVVDRADEYAIKAAFLLNFTKFVEWPEDAFAGPEEPLRLCILGTDPFGEVLDEVIADEVVGGRRLAARRFEDAAEAAQCQLIFMSQDVEEVRLDRAVAIAGADRVLTVGETDEFLRRGGLVRFRLRSGRVRLELNGETLDASRLKVSSKLLRLAEIVRLRTRD